LSLIAALVWFWASFIHHRECTSELATTASATNLPLYASLLDVKSYVVTLLLEGNHDGRTSTARGRCRRDNRW
jgi:hypothetical protein